MSKKIDESLPENFRAVSKVGQSSHCTIIRAKKIENSIIDTHLLRKEEKRSF